MGLLNTKEHLDSMDLKIRGRLLITLLLIPVILACNGRKSANDTESMVKTVSISKDRKLVLPSPPAMLTDSISKTNYMVAHYWDNFDFNDTTLIHEPNINERAVLSFLYGAQLVSKDNAVAAIISLRLLPSPSR